MADQIIYCANNYCDHRGFVDCVAVCKKSKVIIDEDGHCLR